MAIETIFQSEIFTKFALPFLLVFFILFAVLEKTKILGDKKQLNALVAFVVGLIVIGFVFPKEVIENMILFLTVALVVMFVALMLWGFVSGESLDKSILGNNAVKWIVGIGVVVVVLIALIVATGADNSAINF